MADNKTYYYLKLKEDFFNSDEIIILESMPDGYIYSNILLKLYLKSLKGDGKMMFNERIPYNPTVLATLTRHSVGVVEKSLSVFKDLGLIEILDNGAIYMLDIQNYIGKSSTEADRKREYREKIEKERMCISDKNGTFVQTFVREKSDKSTPEIEIEKEIEIKIEKEREPRSKKVLQCNNEVTKCNTINYQQIADMYNDTCVSFPRLTSLSDTRKKSIKARLNTYSIDDFKTLFELAEKSDFLKGKNNRDWTATFDWLIKDSNMAKVLDGNYNAKGDKDAGKSKSDEYDTRRNEVKAHALKIINGEIGDESVFDLL